MPDPVSFPYACNQGCVSAFASRAAALPKEVQHKMQGEKEEEEAAVLITPSPVANVPREPFPASTTGMKFSWRKEVGF